MLALGDRRFERLPTAVRRRVVAVAGGTTRAASVRNGLQALITAHADDWVLVHDAARPCVRRPDVEALIAACRRDPVGGLLAVPVADTVKQADDGGRSRRTLPRERLWRAQTPQMFRLGRLLGRLTKALDEGLDPGDEAAAIEMLGLAPLLVEGSPLNVKVTRPADLAFAEAVLRRRQEALVRIGFGYDVHRFGPGHSVRLGGVTMAHSQGVVAHSDGDVLLHALMDALLGAAALGDIGLHFPPGDARHAGADSRALLRDVAARVAGAWIRGRELRPHAGRRGAAHRRASRSDLHDHRRRPRYRPRSREPQGDDGGGARRARPRRGPRGARRRAVAGHA